MAPCSTNLCVKVLHNGMIKTHGKSTALTIRSSEVKGLIQGLLYAGKATQHKLLI